MTNAGSNSGNTTDGGDGHYRNLLLTTLLRLLLIYFLPVVLLAAFFHIQHRHLIRDTRLAHLQSIAEHQAYTLDLFLRERIINLENVIDDPRLNVPPTNIELQRHLDNLRKTSDTFVDLGWFNAAGDLIAYAGPHPDLESRNYGLEAWFLALRGSAKQRIITDTYMGFREQPHFTIAVNRVIDDRYVVLRAVLSPERIEEYVATLQHPERISTALLSEDGMVQVISGKEIKVSTPSPLKPPRHPSIGSDITKRNGSDVFYAWTWLKTTSWVLLVEGEDPSAAAALISGGYATVIIIIGGILLIELLLIVHRARQVVRHKRKTDKQEADLSGQLVQAAKLATVGELAAGIAHEINNPLAIIAEETGLVRDLMDPSFGNALSDEELRNHLDIIHDATFRARDITRKLLGFVRQEKVILAQHDVCKILDGVLDGMLGRELELSNIRVVRDYSPHLPEITTDRHQLEQVFLNIVKNAIDAMENEGTLTVHTSSIHSRVIISISDTGVGMTREQVDKAFLPFFTTKEVGKGTGLGLSVSYGIIKGLRGQISVDSELGRGSMFTIELPLELVSSKPERSHGGKTS